MGEEGGEEGEGVFGLVDWGGGRVEVDDAGEGLGGEGGEGVERGICGAG